MLIPWLDALWIPVLMVMLPKNQKLWALGFVACNMVMMRLMAELMVWIGYPSGVLDILPYDMMTRGLAVYSVIYLTYMIIGLYSPKSSGTMFMAMSISLFFTASVLFAVIMVL